MSTIHPGRRFFVWCRAIRCDGFKNDFCYWKGYRSAKNPKAPCPQCGDNVSAFDREKEEILD